MFKVDTSLKNANLQRSIRFTEELWNELNMVSGKHNISFNNLVLQCCKYALENMVEKDDK